MKNRRDVCMAKDAGYMEFQGLPVKVKTGCQASPSYKSRYCTSHTPQGCNPVKCIDDEELKETGSNIGIQQKSTDQCNRRSNSCQEDNTEGYILSSN